MSLSLLRGCQRSFCCLSQNTAGEPDLLVPSLCLWSLCPSIPAPVSLCLQVLALPCFCVLASLCPQSLHPWVPASLYPCILDPCIPVPRPLHPWLPVSPRRGGCRCLPSCWPCWCPDVAPSAGCRSMALEGWKRASTGSAPNATTVTPVASSQSPRAGAAAPCWVKGRWLGSGRDGPVPPAARRGRGLCVGQGMAEGLSGDPQFPCSPMATRRASSPPCCSPAASLKPHLLLSLFPPGSLGDTGWSLVLGASSELGLLLQKLPPPPPPALCFHKPNTTTGREKRSSPQPPRDGKHLFTKLRNPRLPTRIRQQGNFTRLPASPRFSGGRFEKAGQGRAARRCSFSANQSGKARHRLHLKSRLAPGAGRNEALLAAPALPCSRASRPRGFSFLPSPWPSSSSCAAARGRRPMAWRGRAEAAGASRANSSFLVPAPRCLPAIFACKQ